MGSVVFLHGLEGSPNGRKASWLKEHYDVVAPTLNTTKARETIAQMTNPLAVALSDTQRRSIFKAPLKAAVSSIEPDTRLVIGSSFGGALLGELVELGLWTGPCLFLASAHCQWSRIDTLRGPAIFIHGRKDTVSPLGPVEEFVLKNGPPHVFWAVDDDHALRSILENGMLHKGIHALIGHQ